MFGLYDGKGAVKTGPCRLVKVRCSLPLIRPSLLFGLPGSARGASLAFGALVGPKGGACCTLVSRPLGCMLFMLVGMRSWKAHERELN